MQSFRVPMYTDVQYPFPIDELPQVPEHNNPVGCYRTNFEFPENWECSNIYVVFEGDVAFNIWLTKEAVRMDDPHLDDGEDNNI